VLNLSRLIQGLEINVIGRCKDCQQYFLNFSLREKFYCNPNCASKSIARLRREKLKKNAKKWEAYHKKQNRYSTDYYIEKRAREGKAVRHRPKKRGPKRIPKMM
jgi:hypothetical protein